MMYVLVAIWLSTQTGIPQDYQRIGTPQSAEDCVKLQLAQPIEHAKDGQIKVYGCFSQAWFGEITQ